MTLYILAMHDGYHEHAAGVFSTRAHAEQVGQGRVAAYEAWLADDTHTFDEPEHGDRGYTVYVCALDVLGAEST